MVTVAQVEYSVTDSLPVPRNLPVLSVYATSFRQMICPGDTVRLSSTLGSSTLGRVIDIADHATASQSDLLAHPDNHVHGSRTDAVIKIQLIICQFQSEDIHPDVIWPISNDETRMATRGLIQVAHTNCVVWFHPIMIVDLIGVFYTSHCTTQTFGAIAGRQNSFYTC